MNITAALTEARPRHRDQPCDRATHTYHPGLSRLTFRVVLLQATALAVGFALAWWLAEGNIVYRVIVPLNLALLVWGVARAVARARRSTLAVSTQGIALYDVNWMVSASWCDVIAIERAGRSIVLVLENPHFQPFGTAAGAGPAMKRARRLGLDRRIRLAPFMTARSIDPLDDDLRSNLDGFPGLRVMGMRWMPPSPSG